MVIAIVKLKKYNYDTHALPFIGLLFAFLSCQQNDNDLIETDPTETDTSLTYIGNVFIENQEQLEFFTQVPYQKVIGDISIQGCTDLNGLHNLNPKQHSINDAVSIESNDALTSLEGLQGLTSIGDCLYIGNNNALENVDGLQNLSTMVYSSVITMH